MVPPGWECNISGAAARYATGARERSGCSHVFVALVCVSRRRSRVASCVAPLRAKNFLSPSLCPFLRHPFCIAHLVVFIFLCLRLPSRDLLNLCTVAISPSPPPLFFILDFFLEGVCVFCGATVLVFSKAFDGVERRRPYCRNDGCSFCFDRRLSGCGVFTLFVWRGCVPLVSC